MGAPQLESHARPIRVLVCDDNPEVRLLLRVVLGGEPRVTVVGEARDGREAVARVAALQPDVITLDLAMPAGGGVDAIPSIRHEAPDVAIVVYTASAPSLVRPELLHGLRVVLKREPMQALRDAIVASGRTR